jgi:hypothetical protein
VPTLLGSQNLEKGNLAMTETFNGNEVPDCRLFKYRPINKRLIDSLVKSSLWCAKPETLNDPFDCRIDLNKSWEQACSLATGVQKEFLQRVLDDPQEFFKNAEHLKNVGICSFSRIGKHPSASVQWTHYADEHKGVRLLYRFPQSFIKGICEQDGVYDLRKVVYKDNVLTNWLASTKTAGPDFINALAAHYFTAKSSAWKHEREERIIRRTPGYLKIPSGYLEQVCFGLRTPQDDVELVKELAKEYCGCKKFYKIEHDEKSDFGLRAVRM